MSYMQEVSAWLDAKLSDGGLLDARLNALDTAKIAELKTEIKTRLLEPRQSRRPAKPRR